jgi:hypothetical protein
MFGFKKKTSPEPDKNLFMEILNRFIQLQLTLPVIDDPKQLIELLNILRNIVNTKTYSYRLDFFVLILIEIAHIYLYNEHKDIKEIKKYLDEIQLLGEKIYNEIGDPYYIIVLSIQNHLFEFINENYKKAKVELEKFEKISKPFKIPEDQKYVSRMMELQNNQNKLNEVKMIYRNRTLKLISMRIGEILQGIKETAIIKQELVQS